MREREKNQKPWVMKNLSGRKGSGRGCPLHAGGVAVPARTQNGSKVWRDEMRLVECSLEDVHKSFCFISQKTDIV